MWTETDSYLEREYEEYKRSLELCEKYKDDDNEEIKFLVKYLIELQEEKFKLDEKNSKLFQEKNIAEAERDNYKQYSSKLEREVKSYFINMFSKNFGKDKAIENFERYIKRNKETCKIKDI